MSRDSNPRTRHVLPVGCVLTLASAALTCLLLLINGALVMAILDSVPTTAPSWARKPEIVQFLLFSLPVLMVVAQWMMIDYVRARLRKRMLNN